MSNIKTMNDVRAYIAKQLDALPSDDSTPAMANAKANLIGKIVSSIAVELKYSHVTGTIPHIDFIPESTKIIKKIGESIKPIEKQVEQQNEIHSQE